MRFRKKPVVIEAMQVPTEGKNERAYMLAVGELMGWLMAHEVDHYTLEREAVEGGHGHPIEIRTLEGVMRADVGDWVIRGVQGEFYPCKPDIFEATYEAVE